MLSDLMRSDWFRRNRPNGFSLLECLVVVALLGILATLAIPSSSAVQRRLELGIACAACGWGSTVAGWPRSGIASPAACSSPPVVGSCR